MIQKKVLFMTVCCLIFCLCSGYIMAGKLVFFVNGGAVGGSKMDPFSYNNSTEDFFLGLSLVESGGISQSFKKSAGFSGGFIYYITPNLGLSLSLTHTKRDIRLDADYQTRMTLGNGTNIMDEVLTWENTGQLHVTPLNFDVTYRLPLIKNLSINAMAGVSIMLYKVDLPSHLGFSGVSTIVDIDTGNFFHFPDYFDLDISIKRDASYQVGFNAGLELEQKLTSWLGISGGFHYFKTTKKEFRWELVRQASFEGKLGNLTLWGVPGIFYTDEVVKEIDLSFFQAFIGFKVYL
jgi:hypothetical protein